ncbi:MAG: hypothetical protein COZ46_01865 [Verrucomicrobia bacterium CG_4_10_14_3_um_filter_43_23]|nr:MAG: hypothetical protein AUJ82_01880 [Verrucomicrobia bacterium CG1_02_43_26]PIP59644.1 MAG: hypothetical protein COX01_03470 [Verrucomicrobia bacterium CG22_combo_CG10-13_8_21_14_all_43_17]PIX58943.1 MAG: hypothetical protein COZ46_01865 [Verrucomicrobia bacterium CG_4_10_14_3_um_filter_43_23]PIY63088.1 MAG: hypothetical protein COY94_00215 [Verrucomicrobia bacterium CG_4_10_14_0_8_um_filter_43_34]PJA43595.1 MAG: hypothetical protein CO175_07140 [Verrucomicrobia bacterium CG_4_9_14_3_um_fi
MKKSSIIIVTLLLVLGIAYYAFNSATPTAKVAAAKMGSAVNAVPGNVKVLAAMEAVVKTQTAGDIQELLAPKNTGSIEVKSNDIVAKLDTSELDREIEHLQLRYEAALKRQEIGSPYEAEKRSLEQDMPRVETLFKHGQLPEAEFNKRKQDLERVTRVYENDDLNRTLEVELLKNELNRRLSQREKMIVRSPIDGLLTENYFLPGAHVYGGESLAKVISKDNMIEVSINEEDFPGISIGQTVSINFLGHGNKLVSGKVTSLLATANADTKRRSVFVQLNSAEDLAPGMTGQASITKATHDNVVIVPRSALTGNFVYVINKGKVELRKIVPGFIGFDKVEIKEGLKSGEVVIVEDIFNFRNGQRVKTQKISG